MKASDLFRSRERSAPYEDFFFHLFFFSSSVDCLSQSQQFRWRARVHVFCVCVRVCSCWDVPCKFLFKVLQSVICPAMARPQTTDEWQIMTNRQKLYVISFSVDASHLFICCRLSVNIPSHNNSLWRQSSHIPRRIDVAAASMFLVYKTIYATRTHLRWRA